MEKRNRRADIQEIVQNFLLIWLDEKIDESSDDYRKYIKQLRQTVNTIEKFYDRDECIDYMSQLENEKIFLIISGSLCTPVVPCIHDMTQLYSIYIFCRQKDKYEEWAKSWSKIKDIFADIDSLCNSIRQTAQQCDEDSIAISGVSSFHHIEPSFMYTQLLKEIILEINYKNEEEEIKDLAEYACQKHSDNEQQLKIIREFAQDYKGHFGRNNHPVYWYTRECFTYRMLNKALGTLQIETLLKMGIFLRDLHKNIEKLHLEQIQDSSSLISKISKVYRGQIMTKKDFENKIKQGGLMSFNNFLSTTDDSNVAIAYISGGPKIPDPNMVRVLFEITIDQSSSFVAFASIRGVSHFPEESEILFSTHTIFRVQHIKELIVKDTETTGMKICHVKLTFTTDSDNEQLNELTKHFREEIKGTGWERLGSLLSKLGANDKAEQVYKMLLEGAPTEYGKAYYYNQLGLVYSKMGEYSKALSFYEQSLEIVKIPLPSNHPDLATSYNNIGKVYKDMGEYSKALEFYEKSNKIYEIAVSSTDPLLAASFNNIGGVYMDNGEYSKALSFYEQSLKIWKIALPPNHPHLATSYSHIGGVYQDMGEYSKAFEFYEKSLEIDEKAFPPNHPDLATSYSNIGTVYQDMGEYSKALEFYDRSHKIYEKALPPNHPDLATSYSNSGGVYKHIGKYLKALEFYEKSLEIRKIALPPNHPNLATSYNNIGLVYSNMGEYSKALGFYEKELEITKMALSPTHPDLTTSYSIIGGVYQNIGEYSKSLEFYNKSHRIYEKTRLPNHSLLATSLGNIGRVYEDMGEYSKSLEFYEKSHKIYEKALPPNDPNLATSYSNIGRIYQNMGEYPEVLEFYEKSFEIRKVALPPNHPDLAVGHLNFTACYEKMGGYTRALKALQNAFQIHQKHLKKVIKLLAQRIIGLTEYTAVSSITQRHLIPFKSVLHYLKKHYDQNIHNTGITDSNIGDVE